MKRGEGLEHVEAATLPGARFRYFDFVMAAFVAILLLSNVIGAGKRAVVDLPGIGAWPFGAGILFFPISYVIGDVLTEVYGYARARRASGRASARLLFMAFMAWSVVACRPRRAGPGRRPMSRCSARWRIVFASICAFWVGEFVNSFVLARMKIWTKGRHLWTRTIGSTIVGEGVDSLIFYPLAFYGVAGWTVSALLQGAAHPMGAEGGLGGAADPGHLCRRRLAQAQEGIDVYDEGTDFTPFAADL